MQNILLQANRKDAPKGADCTSPALNTDERHVVGKFCFNDGGTSTTQWMPRGVTTAADAQDDELWGDKQAILVSWYNKDTSSAKGVRVSFWTPTRATTSTCCWSTRSSTTPATPPTRP